MSISRETIDSGQKGLYLIVRKCYIVYVKRDMDLEADYGAAR